VVVYPDPSIAPGKTIAITGGQAQVLDPQISGDIVTYLWTPSDGLSDNSVRNPVADPIKSTTYLLKVTTAENCSASQEIKVNVFRDLVLPSGFTPNNDGHNDVFYVLAGPPGSQIGSLSVFNKWGEMVFQVRDAAPGDPAFGWNGTYKGSPAPEGGYVYFAVIRMADGSLQRLQGTILLVR
jgi:gliding motility-associated-like protein